jgi:hypothetical protein
MTTNPALQDDRAPYARRGRLWDDTLTGMQRLRRVDFLLGLGLDPSRVPDGARIDHDPATGEYRVQIIARSGQLVWVRRLLSPAPPVRAFEVISEELRALRDFYGEAHQLAHRGTHRVMTYAYKTVDTAGEVARAAAALDRIARMSARGA